MTKLLLISILVSACAKPQILKEFKTEYILPPESLLIECDYPTPIIETNFDLAAAYIERGKALKECNTQLQSIRSWIDQTK